MGKSNSTFHCGVCYGEVPAHRKSCPHCGADSETGLFDNRSGYLPDDEVDYEGVLEEIQGKTPRRVRPRGISWGVYFLAILVLIGFIWMMAKGMIG